MTSVDVIRNFADKIPGFSDLTREDQVKKKNFFLKKKKKKKI